MSMKEDEQRNPDVEMAGSGRRGAAEKHLVAKAQENPREQKQKLRRVVEKLFKRTHANGVRRYRNKTRLKRSAELPSDDPRNEIRSRGLHLDDDADRHVH